MSAIWGYIDYNKNIDEAMDKRGLDAISDYAIDRVEKKTIDGVYFACAHQHITNEDINDISPIYDEKAGILFNGDCFLYNRSDVISQIENNTEYIDYCQQLGRTIGDIELSYICYLIYGKKFVEHLRGSFSFAIYNYNTEELELFTDHLVKKYLCYYMGNDGIYFASTYQLIKACSKHKFEINRDFIINAFRNISPINFFVPEITPFKGIYHLENASHVTINANTHSVSKENYWNPLKNIRKLKLSSDEEYKKLFLDSYKKVALGMLRSAGETGIMLSGGLDSSSVAAWVAPELDAHGKTLYSYTSVPSSNFPAYINNSIIENESYLIEEQKKIHKNLEPRYINHDDTNIMDKMQSFQAFFSIPVKPSINMLNIDSMSKRAKEDGCKILLGGGNGNPTVSYGETGTYLSLTLLDGHPFKALKELSNYCKLHKISRKNFTKKWIKMMRKSAKEKPEEYSYYLKTEDLKKYGLEHANADHIKRYGTEYLVNEEQKNNFMYMTVQYIQKSFFYTILSLKYGYAMLDPTLSVEMIEFALSLPNDCFFKDGIDRRLIRVYMKDMIPEAITSPLKGYGVQSADFVFNIYRDWDRIKDNLFEILDEPLIFEYLDKDEIDQLKERLKKNQNQFTANDACAATQIGSLGYFLRENS